MISVLDMRGERMKKTDDILEIFRKLGKTEKGITLINSEGEKFISYREVWNRSFYVYEYLKKQSLTKGSEVIIKCEENEYFIYTFLACAIGAFTAIPLDASKDNFNDSLLDHILENAENAVIISDIYEDAKNNAKVIKITDLYEKILSCEESLEKKVNSSPDDVLYIMYSSGTTDRPHGVIITKSNVLASAEGFIKQYQIEESDKFLSWSPLTHCYGMVTFFLVPILAEAEVCLISTKLYMKTPLIWADWIKKYRATRIGTIPFALKHFNNIWENSNKKFDWDFSSVKILVIGGEQVNYGLYKEFCDIVKPYGFCIDQVKPLYGLSEATIMVTANGMEKTAKRYRILNQKLSIGDVAQCEEVKEGESEDNTFVEMGNVLENMQLSIRDEEYNELPLGCVGNVYVKGPCVTQGYYKDEEATKKVFGEDDWLCTGDVGVIYQGSLLIIGRIKELVVANGKKISCQVVESIIQSVLFNTPYQQCTVSNGISGENQNEKVIAFVKTDKDFSHEYEWKEFIELKRKICSVVFEKIGLTIAEVIPVKEIPKTNSGKAFRRRLTENYNAGAYQEIIKKMNGDSEGMKKQTAFDGQVYSKHMIQTWIVEYLEKNFQVKVTNLDNPIFEYGIISINIPTFVQTINEKFNVSMVAGDIFSYFTIAKLSNYITLLIQKSDSKTVTIEQNLKTEKEKIAIVGMSCRLPGGGNSIDEFWNTLVNGNNGVIDVPEDRWDLEKYYDEDKTAPGKMYCKKGGFLNCSIDEFDARFFNISPKEAAALDPQQRMLLELTWEAFENANMDIEKYNGSNTGVYVGICNNEYHLSQLYSGDLETINAYSLTGSCMSTACGRVSYTFGFEGPCIAVDTACSSALTALHLACTAIQAGEADMQVIAGINLMESPSTNIGFSKLQATSVDGYSKSFDESANGYGRGEGGGVILLKRLSDAIRDKNEILGIIRGTGINQDGKSNGLTAPNGESQEKLIRKTMIHAGVNPLDIDYVEMHGTGTKLGDPIEVGAVGATYGKNRTADNLLKIGSVKSNIGHLESAAGIASIIKVLLSLKHNLIPANLHFHTPNPLINWEEAKVEVIDKHTVWKKENGLRMAAVNGFGFGGSNAHVIIEEYKKEESETIDSAKQEGLNYILKISAQSESSLNTLIREYRELMENSAEEELENIIYTANIGRTDLNLRFVVTGGSKKELLERIDAYLKDGFAEGVICNAKDAKMGMKDRKIVFMFTGQGSQYVNMGKMLYETNKTFRTAFDECDKLFRPYLVKSITSLVYGDKADAKVIERTVFAQPLIFTIEYALYEMWKEIGVKPDVVMGHSIGEYAAAVAAGMISLEDAVKLVSTRGRLMDMCPGHGKMATIFASEEAVREILKGYENTVCIAAKNAQETCVISGEGEDVEKVEAKAAELGIRVKELTVSHAFHSMLMEPILDDFYEIAKEVSYREGDIRFVSALYGRELEQGEILDAEYWTKHVREKVDFYQAVTSIDKREEYLLLEVGSNRVLAALGKLIFGDEQVIASSLSIKKPDKEYLADEIGYVYASGVNIDWTKVTFAGRKSWKTVTLPNYPYDKKKYWMDLKYDRQTAEVDADDYHPILGQRIDITSINDAVMFQSKFTATEPYFMREHVIYGAAISPAAAHCAMMLLAVNQISDAKSCVLSKIEFRAPLAAQGEDQRKVQIYIDKDNEQPNFSILSRDYDTKNGKWLLHAKGNVTMGEEYLYEDLHGDIDTYKQLPFKENLNETIYYFMEKSGFLLGEGFRRIKKIHFGEGECICLLESLKSIPHYKDYILYPGVIDSIFQTGIAMVLEQLKEATNVEEGENRTVIPYYMEKLTYNYRKSEQLWCYTKSRMEGDITYADVIVYNEVGEVIVKVDNLMAKTTDNISLLRELKNLNKMYFHTDWMPVQEYSSVDVDLKDKNYMLISDNESIMEVLKEKFKNYEVFPICVSAGASYNKRQKDSYEISLEDKEDFRKLFNDIESSGTKNGFQILYINAEDKVPRVPGKAMNYEAVKGLLYLIQVINEERLTKNSKIKIVTKNAQNIGIEELNLSSSMVFGLSKTVSIEYAELFNGIIDADEIAFKENDKFIQELLSNNVEEICVRGEKRYIAKLISHTEYLKKQQNLSKKIVVQEDASYLITGGTGALGLVYAKQLVDAGAKNLILLSRRDPGEAAQEAIRQFTEAGVKVANPHADVCDFENLKSTLQEVCQSMPAIRGVIHTAGVLNDKMMLDFNWDEFVKVLQPKVQGTVNLYYALKENTLDFFMMLSSITSIIGNMGQANYASANYFMNVFASFLNKKNIPGYTFCWGPWAESGMAAGKDAVSNTMETMGMNPIEREQGKDIIADFFEQPFENLLIADVDWNVLGNSLKSAAGKTAFLSKLMSAEQESVSAVSDEQSSEVLRELQELQKDERKEFLMKKLQVICGKVMGFDQDQISPDDAFREQGADSLMIFSMRTAINKLLGTDINVSAFFNYPTISKLTSFILDEILQFEEKEEENSQDNGVADILSEIAKLTE